MANEFKIKNGYLSEGNSQITGSLNVSAGITGSLFGTSSYAVTASYVQTSQTASYVLSASYATTASYVQNAQSASYVQTAQTASYVLNAVSSSFATTASYLSGTIASASYAITASYVENAQTASYVQNAVSASYATQAGNTSTINISVFGSDVESYLLMSNVAGTTGVAIGGDGDLRYNPSTNKLSVGSVSATSLTGSLLGTASYATQALSSSYALSASYYGGSVTSASYALTASYVQNAQSASYVQNAQSASYVQNAQTASYVQTAQTASYVLNAVSASYATQALSASYAVNGGVTKILAGANVNLSPISGLGDVTITSFGTNLYNTATGSYGSFYDTGSVLAASATAIYSMSISTTDISNGVFVSASGGDNTRVKFTNAGTYNVQFSSQFSNSDNANQDVFIWIRKNGTDIPDSSGVATVPPFKAGSNGQIIAAWNYYLNLSAGDYIQLCWHVEQANVITLETIAAGTSPTHPRTPSTILTAQRVDTFLSNTGSFSGSFTGVLTGTASYATQALSSSFARTASYVQNAQSASYVLNAVSSSFASTASYVGPTLTQDLTLNGNLTVNGTASYTYVTASQLDVGTNTISVNVAEPAERFGGLIVYDSGSLSHQATASLFWDSLNNHWVYQNASGSTYTGGMLMAGPRNTGSLGDEPSLTRWFVARSDGGDHLNNTQIYSSASTHVVTGSLTVTGGVTGSLLGTASLATTASYVLNAVSASFSTTASYVQNAQSASYVLQAVSASYALSATTAQTASYVLNAISASYALNSTTSQTASYVQTAQTASYVQNAQTASYVLNAVSASYARTASYVQNAQTASYVLNAVSASYATQALSSSFATTASYVNTLNQNVLITGSLTVGSSSAGASENTLTLGARDAASEGGQIGFNAPGGTYTSASFIDNWQNKVRILKGNNTTSTGLIAQWDIHTTQLQLPAYVNASSFAGTATANLAVDSGGNVITVSTTGGSVFPYVGNAVITGSLTTTGIIYAQPNGGMYFQGGDDAALYDINVSNHMGIYGVQDSTVGSIKLGSGGGIISGKSSNIGIGTINPTSASFQVNGNVWANSFTGSLLGTASYATTTISASYALNATTANTASYVLQAVSASFATLSQTANTASYVQTAQTASYVLNAVSSSYALSASFAVSSSRAVSASFATTASYYGGSVTSASYALTASYVNPLVQNVIVTGSLDVSGSFAIYDESNIKAIQANITKRALFDTSAVASVNWSGRGLYSPASSLSVDWNDNNYLDSNVYQRDYKSRPTQNATSATINNPYASYLGDLIEVDGSDVIFDGTVNDGMLVYLDTNATWYPVSQGSTTATKMIGIACNVAGPSGYVLLEGHVVISDTVTTGPYVQGADHGLPIYVKDSTTTGQMSTTLPTTAGGNNVIRVLGHCYWQNTGTTSQWMMKFRPSNDWITI